MMLRWNFSRDEDSKPSLVMSKRRFSLSSNRMTIFSPYSVGTVDTRTSNSFFLPSALSLIMMRPSWGQVFHQVGEFLGVGGCASVKPRDGIPNRRFGRHHRLHIETSHELDVVHCEDVRGIRHGDG